MIALLMALLQLLAALGVVLVAFGLGCAWQSGQTSLWKTRALWLDDVLADYRDARRADQAAAARQVLRLVEAEQRDWRSRR